MRDRDRMWGEKQRVQTEDRKVYLFKKRIYKRLDLGEFELYDSVEGPHTHLRLSFHPTIILFFFFFQKKNILASY